MKKRIFAVIVGAVLLSPAMSYSGDYDFNYDSKNDMRGAFMMCATTGFTQGDCSKVLTKCWQPPMIWFQRHRSHYHVKTHCVEMPNFFVSSAEKDQILVDARRIAAEGGMTPGAMQAGGQEPK